MFTQTHSCCLRRRTLALLSASWSARPWGDSSLWLLWRAVGESAWPSCSLHSSAILWDRDGERQRRQAEIWTGKMNTDSLQWSTRITSISDSRNASLLATSRCKTAPWSWSTATKAFYSLLESQCKYSKLQCSLCLSRPDSEAGTVNKA